MHLRLKSIYKAFKQSGASMSSGSSGGGSSGGNMGGKYSNALRSLAEGSDGKDTFSGSNFDQSMASEVAAVLQTASKSMASGKGTPRKRLPDPSPAGMRNVRSTTTPRLPNSRAATDHYFRKTQAEIEAANKAAEAEAEAAAAALLAELDEEQATTANAISKKSKKKKKKKDKKQAEQASAALETTTLLADHTKFASDDQKNLQAQSLPKKKKKGGAAKENDLDEDSSDDEMDFAQLIGGSKRSSAAVEKKKDAVEEKPAPPPPKPKPKSPTPPPPKEEPKPNTDFDTELAVLLADDDEEGLEAFLAKLKGVPGLSAARKTAKKALKKIKEAKQPKKESPQPKAKKDSRSEVTEVKAKSAKSSKKSTVPSSENFTTIVESAPDATNHQLPLLQIVSRTNLGTARTGVSGNASVPASARAECVMHMSPVVVGWVIGKGGSRIKDMMEESGTKIWIDQQSMADNEARVVYVSGKRSCVDNAVRLLKDLVSKAPAAANGSPTTSSAVKDAIDTPITESIEPTKVSTKVASAPASAPMPAAPRVQSVPSMSTAPAIVEPHPSAEVTQPPASFAEATVGASTATMTAQDVLPLTFTNQPPLTSINPNDQNIHTPKSNPMAPPQPMHDARQAPTPLSWDMPIEQMYGSELGPMAPLRPAPQSIVGTLPPEPTYEGMGSNSMLFDSVTTEFACDPRFVALLIGRRGWNVKHIQAESGANINIDQDREPPKIRISGRSEDVRKAEQLVRDVLKYPPAQIHGGEYADIGPFAPEGSDFVMTRSPSIEQVMMNGLFSGPPVASGLGDNLPRRHEHCQSVADMRLVQEKPSSPTSMLRSVPGAPPRSVLPPPPPALADVPAANPMDDMYANREEPMHQYGGPPPPPEGRMNNYSPSHYHERRERQQYEQQAPPPPPQHHQPPSNSGTGSMYGGSPSATRRISEYIPPGGSSGGGSPSSAGRGQSIPEWGQAPRTREYSTLPPFTSDARQVSGGTLPGDEGMINDSFPGEIRDPFPGERPPSSGGLIPEPFSSGDRGYESGFSNTPSHSRQHDSAPPLRPSYPEQVPRHREPQIPSHQRISDAGYGPPSNDYKGTDEYNDGSSGGWEQAHNNLMESGPSWTEPQQTQSQAPSQAPAPATAHQQSNTPINSEPTFHNPFKENPQNLDISTLLSDNKGAPSASNKISDDSIMVDDFFSSLGQTTNDDGLLKALGDVSIAGAGTKNGNNNNNNNSGGRPSYFGNGLLNLDNKSGEDELSSMLNSRLGVYSNKN